MSKAENRRLRKEEKAQQLQIANERLNARMVQFVKQPKAIAAPPLPLVKGPKIAVIPAEAKKEARAIVDPEASLFDLPMSWCTTQSDRVEKWSWDEPRDWTDEEFAADIQPAFQEMERLTWGVILNEHKVPAKGGRHVPKHHSQAVSSLCQEARDRWANLQLEQYDEAFRFRYGNKKRAWGIRLRDHFYLIWWERNHQIYPVGP
ncbi:hypothetical protein SD235_13560 [Burkholderia cepacia]|uniref:hypothetical protein n=1 Tax=Burkholderia cepacia TaxID=292 RepID=UPI003A4E408E